MDWNIVTRFAELQIGGLVLALDTLPDKEERIEALKQCAMLIAEQIEIEEDPDAEV